MYNATRTAPRTVARTTTRTNKLYRPRRSLRGDSEESSKDRPRIPPRTVLGGGPWSLLGVLPTSTDGNYVILKNYLLARKLK